MYMLKPALLLSWAATLLASPLQGLTAVLPEEPYPPLANTTFSLRSDTKPCPSSKHHYPTLSKWKQALNQYCDRHTPKGISSDEALTLTYTIPAWDKKPIKWIFRVSIDNYVQSVFSEDDPVSFWMKLFWSLAGMVELAVDGMQTVQLNSWMLQQE
ncbi:hypothetical protein DDE83_003039 [Stemphylium lycopersici]|uniref:Uncharacterized protein n=1 Tax=Stemphylium lycopersici TaxID=183478 RepID=A0A364N8H3_STELY|nr:hypothetical protein DDE83_003039 [Stemphylium lycopersici]